MKIFRSLNCSLCLTPFAPVANQPRSPRILNCGEAICNECFETEKPLEEEQRKHQCQRGDGCFDDVNFAYFLIDILSQDSLKLSPMELGYMLIKPFQLPECHICHEEYSSNLRGRSSFVLWCNHTICTDCYYESRMEKAVPVIQYRFGGYSEPARWDYSVTCPVCHQETTTFDDTKRNRLQDFLAELPAMTRALEEMSTTKYRFCEECNMMDIVDRMFYCDGCRKKLCGTCVVRKHGSHSVPSLLETEATILSDELQKVSSNEIKTYKCLFPEMHKELVEKIDTFEKKLLSTEEALKRAANFEDLKDKHDKCTLLKKDFETVSEEYMPSLRKYDAKVTDLIERLDQNLGH